MTTEEFEDIEEPITREERDAERMNRPIENYDETPLLVHAGTGKRNTVAYIKVTRVDGVPGTRGYKGRLPHDATIEELARRYGNGCYKLDGCNGNHKVLVSEHDVEVSVPEYEDTNKQTVDPSMLSGANAMLHAMGMLKSMAERHQGEQSQTASDAQTNVTTMADRMLEAMTTFTAAARDNDRESHNMTLQQMQGFFAAMMQMSEASHERTMQMMQAAAERERERNQQTPDNEGRLVEMLIGGMQLARELGDGEGDESWVKALREGGGMLNSLAQMATAQRGGALPQLPIQPRALPAQQNPQPTPTNGTPPGPKRPKVPFSKDEVRGFARLRAQLRKRGISTDDFLTQSIEHLRTAPDSEVFSENDGPDKSESAAQQSTDAVSAGGPAPTDDV